MHMNIQPFKMKVNPEQSRTVQEVLFANGYKWAGYEDTTIRSLHKPCLNLAKWQSEEVRLYCPNFNLVPEPELTFEQFKQMYMNDTRTFTVQVPEGYEIDKDKSTFEQIVFKAVDKLPRKWEDLKLIRGFFINLLGGMNEFGATSVEKVKGLFPTKEYAQAALALAQLLQLRQAWIGEWKPDWKNYDQNKYAVISDSDKLTTNVYGNLHKVMSFPTQEMATDFLNTFKDLLETAKPLL